MLVDLQKILVILVRFLLPLYRERKPKEIPPIVIPLESPVFIAILITGK
jgi:hypothetical protein